MQAIVRGEMMSLSHHGDAAGVALRFWYDWKAHSMQPLIDHSGTYQTVFFGVLAVTAIPAALATIHLRVRAGASRHDRGSFVGIQTIAGVGVLLAYWLARHFGAGTITVLRTEVFALGIALMPLGMLLNAYAIHQLGRFFTVQVAVRPDQPVVQTGPYRYLRHPAYTGQLITFLGIALVFTNWASIVAILACAFGAYAYRIRVEEQVLRTELGAPYLDYMSRTRRLIPFIF